MDEGRLVCVDYIEKLQARFNDFFKLSVSINKLRKEEADILLEEVFGNEVTLLSDIGGTRIYKVPKGQVSLGAIFAKMEIAMESGIIVDWGMNQTSLEEVFFNYVQKQDLVWASVAPDVDEAVKTSCVLNEEKVPVCVDENPVQ